MERDKTYLRSISTGKIILDRLTTQPSYTPKTDQDPKTDQEIYTTVYFLNVQNTPLELVTMSSSSYHSNALHDSMKSSTVRVVEMGDGIKGTFMP